MSKDDFDEDEFGLEPEVTNEDIEAQLEDQADGVDDETAELYEKIAALTEALQRERADTTNIRRRHDEQIASLKTTVKASVVRDLLPVVDNFERALKHVPKELEKNDFVKGVQGLVKQFDKTLADMGVQKIKTVGEPFNPHFHEAVSVEEGDGNQEIVSEELQAGYQLGKGSDVEVLRPAMVRVKS
ncbi:MAG TPA: nucleotide exchange factor GrpE [Candidatus Saccharimonadales bacterium]